MNTKVNDKRKNITEYVFSSLKTGEAFIDDEGVFNIKTNNYSSIFLLRDSVSWGECRRREDETIIPLKITIDIIE